MTTQEIEDPFAGANDLEDEFETAKTEYVRLEDLDGRLCVFDALRMGEKTGTDGPYPFITANVIVVDGPEAEIAGVKVPGVVEGLHVIASGVIPQLEPYVGKHKPFLARLDSVPSNRNRKIKVMGVKKHEVTDADKAAARGPWRAYRAAN